jgi:hypothetical protein
MIGGTHFAILICGHWIADPHNMLASAHEQECPRGCGKQLIIARPYDPIAHMINPN